MLKCSVSAIGTLIQRLCCVYICICFRYVFKQGATTRRQLTGRWLAQGLNTSYYMWLACLHSKPSVISSSANKTSFNPIVTKWETLWRQLAYFIPTKAEINSLYYLVNMLTLRTTLTMRDLFQGEPRVHLWSVSGGGPSRHTQLW